jgi:chemotaxis protein MotB
MRKKRQGNVSHERWLVSYADFITLLFAFFVVLFATGQSDKHKKVELAASIHGLSSDGPV